MTDREFKKNNSGPFLLCMAGIIFFGSCSYLKKKDEPEKKAVARVYDQYLYKEDISKIVAPGISSQDSIMTVRNYIESWIKQNVILHKAEENLGEDKKDVDQQLKEYRNSLITFIYQKELIRQKLDTNVTSEEIEKYYVEHQHNFILKDNIIKVRYLKTNKKAPKLDKVREWYKASGIKEERLLEDYCHQFAIDYLLNDSTWLLFDDLLKKVPIKTYDKENFLQNNRYIEVSDSSNIYFINIKDFQVKESNSPLSFEKDNIKALIINKRKLELIREMERTTYANALKNNEFEIYESKN